MFYSVIKRLFAIESGTMAVAYCLIFALLLVSAFGALEGLSVATGH